MTGCAMGCRVAAALWFMACEYYRGRPTTPSRINIMTFVSPLGAIALAAAGLICLLYR